MGPDGDIGKTPRGIRRSDDDKGSGAWRTLGMKSLPAEGERNIMHALHQQRKKQRRIELKAIVDDDHLPAPRLIALLRCDIPRTSVEIARLRFEGPAAGRFGVRLKS